MKKHPQHLAREIRGMMTGHFTAWSIYPDQLPAMERVIARRIERHRYGRTIASTTARARRQQTVTCRALARELLDLVGLVPPASQSKIENRKSKIR